MFNTLDLLRSLIPMRSVSDNIPAVNRVQDKMFEVLQNEGLYCTMEEFPSGHRILFASTVPGKTPDLLFNAHLDVVPASDESQYTPRLDGDMLYGRGSDDCLGNAVCIAEILARVKVVSGASVGAVFTGDEETGGLTTAGMIERGYGAKKLILIMDSNIDDGICIAQKGILILNLIARGRGGHSASPWCFENPIDKLVRGYAKLLEVWKNPERGDIWHDSMAACIVSGGAVHNQIPECAKMTLNFRFIEEDGIEKLSEFVRRTTGLEVEVETTSPVVAFPDSAPVLRKLLAEMQTSFPDKTLAFQKMCGATDARHFKSLGVPVASIGVKGFGCHSPAEHVSTVSIAQYADILTVFAGRI